jgi:hypothetical protein
MARRDDAPRDLLFVLLALQNAMVTRDQLVAFGAWTAARDRSMDEVLAEHSALDPEEQGLLKALVPKHLKRHGSDPEKSLTALELGRSSRERLARLGDPDVQASLARLGTGSG